MLEISGQRAAIKVKGSIMKISKTLQIVILSSLALGLPSSGQAQTDRVNLYDWTAEPYPSGWGNPPPIVESSNSAEFIGGYDGDPYGPVFFEGILTGNLDTTPGAAYEISFTMQNEGQYYLGNPFMSFGNFSTNCDLTIGETYTGPLGIEFIPENYDFTVVATSPITTMSFNVVADNGQGVLLSNVSVMEVPEMSVTRLFGFCGCVLVLARQCRELSQKRKQN